MAEHVLSPLDTNEINHNFINTNLSSGKEASEYVPRSFTLEQTIDLLERRQEAAVLRHLRELNMTSPVWAVEWGRPLAHYQPPRGGPHPYTTPGFGTLTKAEIAEVMAGEQRMLESRIRRSVSAQRPVKVGKQI